MDTLIEVNTGPLMQSLEQLAKHELVRANVWALNDMAAEIRDYVTDRMNVVFDRPTPFTQRAFMVRGATANSLQAAVQLIPGQAKRHYLKVQEEGGTRAPTGFEAQIARSLPYPGIIRSILPGDNAKLDEFGNWSTRERKQVQSALGAQRDAASNTTAASRKRHKKRTKYFVPVNGGLYPGIYKREHGARRDDIGVVAIFSERVPSYQPRLEFNEEAQRLFDEKMGAHLARTLGKVIAKRFGGA